MTTVAMPFGHGVARRTQWRSRVPTDLLSLMIHQGALISSKMCHKARQ